MDIFLVILFMVLGIIFLLLEIFFLPGITFGAIFGGGFVVASVWYAFVVLGTQAGFITMISGGVLFLISVWLFLRLKVLDKLSLHRELDGKVASVNDGTISVGQKGRTLSRMAPIGMVRINDVVVEAKSFEGLIDENTEIEVVSATSNQIVVKPIE